MATANHQPLAVVDVHYTTTLAMALKHVIHQFKLKLNNNSLKQFRLVLASLALAHF